VIGNSHTDSRNCLAFYAFFEIFDKILSKTPIEYIYTPPIFGNVAVLLRGVFLVVVVYSFRYYIDVFTKKLPLAISQICGTKQGYELEYVEFYFVIFLNTQLKSWGSYISLPSF
jgi:hypothetical protein